MAVARFYRQTRLTNQITLELLFTISETVRFFFFFLRGDRESGNGNGGGKG